MHEMKKIKAPLSRLERFLLGLLLVRFAVVVVRAPLFLNPPEVWRQVVTLGVAMRYWLRWTVEANVRMPLLPAVLDSGNTQGIMPQEFPLLNLLGAPAFYFGPAVGRALAMVVANAFVLFLVLWNARIWRGRKIMGIEPFAAMLLLPVFSISLYWSERFMPDFPSVVLVCMAVGVSWEGKGSWRNRLASFALASLGLLMKPTAIIVFVLFLAHERPWKKLRDESGWIFFSIAVALSYYTLGMSWIHRYQEIPALIGVGARPIGPGVLAFFKNVPTILKFYWERAFFLGGSVLVFGISVWSHRVRRTSVPWLLWALTLLQFFLMAVLDGVGLFSEHDYYLLGMTPLFALLLIDAWRKNENAWIAALLLIGISVPVIESCAIDLKTLYKVPMQSVWALDRQCQDLTARHPEFPWGQGQPFRSPREDYPMLGLYFGERVGSLTSAYGFFWKDSPLPAECRAVDRTEDVVLVKC
jgi:hypothetical protein